MRIYPPRHMKPQAAEVYRGTANHLQKAGIYHESDKPLIEGYANLVIRILTMEAEEPDDAIAHARAIIAMTAKLEATAKTLGLTLSERRKREPAGKKTGRPRKNTGTVAEPADSSGWEKLGVIQGGKQ